MSSPRPQAVRPDEIQREHSDMTRAAYAILGGVAVFALIFVVTSSVSPAITVTGTSLFLVMVLGLLYLGVRRSILMDELIVLVKTQEQLATHDTLTGLYNRRFLDEIYRLEREKAIRFGKPVSLILLDVDHFKAVNDQYGHQAGDEVLIGVANKLTATLRASDIVARYGGEEFILLLPDTDMDAAFVIAESLRTRMEMHPCAHGITVTGSFGVVSSDDGEFPDIIEMIKRADGAVYEAKAAGRNVIKVGGTHPPLDGLMD